MFFILYKSLGIFELLNRSFQKVLNTLICEKAPHSLRNLNTHSILVMAFILLYAEIFIQYYYYENQQNPTQPCTIMFIAHFEIIFKK